MIHLKARKKKDVKEVEKIRVFQKPSVEGVLISKKKKIEDEEKPRGIQLSMVLHTQKGTNQFQI